MPVTVYSPTPEVAAIMRAQYVERLAKRLQRLIDAHRDEELAEMVQVAKVVHPEWFAGMRDVS